MIVYVLVTCREESLWPYSELFLKTIRVGFPTADLHVISNGLTDEEMNRLELKVRDIGGQFHRQKYIPHHTWIYHLITNGKLGDPFWICDTDMIFYEAVEHWTFDEPLAGYLIPEFHDEFSRSITRARIHTSLMRIDPGKVMHGIEQYKFWTRETDFTPTANLFDPLVIPFNGKSHFYDTCAMLYHAVGGKPFSDAQKDAYFHFHHGTFSDLVLPTLKNEREVTDTRNAIFADPNKGRGMWRVQDAYFQSRQLNEDGLNVIADVDPKDAETARNWNVMLCNANQSAMTFCDLWYRYCHGIDDLVDTVRDGRPRMSKEQMISLFFHAALLYNSDFYIQNRNLLFPIILQTTNTYQDSVAWEKAPEAHLRIMADVFRTCGNEMYVMIALICGGEAHMRKMSMMIKERDWLGQHDTLGRPI